MPQENINNYKYTADSLKPRLQNAIHLANHLLTALENRKVKEWASDCTEDIDNLVFHKSVLEKQLKRLNDNEFRIAVVGLEKAGKSSFVNAWLGCDLLPNKDERCTYTTTQVYSSSDSRMEVLAKSRTEFDRYRQELESKVNAPTTSQDERSRAEADLDSINQNLDILNQTIAKGNRTLPFVNLSDIKKELWNYIADVKYAHAIKEVRIYTNQLASIDGVSFYDVPGLNSGLGKHIEESKAMLSDCDGIILIKRADQPSLEGSEQNLIKFALEGDSIPVQDKLFVFLSRIDSAASRNILDDQLQKAVGAWYQFHVQSNNIFHGSAVAHLICEGVEFNEPNWNVPKTRQNLQAKIAELKGVLNDDKLVQHSGIPAIKTRIEHFLKNERGDLLLTRCKPIFNSFMKVCEKIISDPECIKIGNMRVDELQKDIEDGVLTGRRQVFRTYLEEKQQFINSKERNLADAADDSDLRKYKEDVENGATQLREKSKSIFNNLVAKHTIGGIFAPGPCNHEFRKHIHAELMSLIEKLSDLFANRINHDIEELKSFIGDILFNSEKITHIYKTDKAEMEKLLKYGTQALFLRALRPILTSVILYPLGDIARKNCMKKYANDIDMLDTYAGNEEDKGYRNFKKYIKYGYRIIEDAKVRAYELGPTDNEENHEENHKENQAYCSNVSEKTAENRNEVEKEVQADIDAIKIILTSRAYEASGLNSFRREELLKVIYFYNKAEYDKKLEIFERELRKQNLKAWDILPDDLKSIPAVSTRLYDDLKQLREARLKVS